MRLLYILMLLIVVSACSPYTQPLATESCTTHEVSESLTLKATLDKLVNTGVPGVSLAAFSEEKGWQFASAGFAKLEDRTAMEVCHLQYLQSVAKTYLAAATLKLSEAGRIALDTPLINYLPQYRNLYEGVESVTVRMLMNHTSGIPEYNSQPLYVTQLLQTPDRDFTQHDYIEYTEKQTLSWKPGTKYGYRNTNYVLLAMVVDKITGDHAQYISQSILRPLGLQGTFYRDAPGYPLYPMLVNTYWDRYANGMIENISRMQRNNVAALTGDDGIVATPQDAVLFLKGLLTGKILNDSSLSAMKTWVNDRNGKPAYGLGLDIGTIAGRTAIGHSGGGLGAGCQLYYFPEQKTYVFIAINLGTVTESPIQKRAEPLLEEIYNVILQ